MSFEWHLQGRVYIVHVPRLITPVTLATMSQGVLDMLNTSSRTQPVHLIYNAESVHLKLELRLHEIQTWTAHVYAHPFTASIVTVIGLNHFNKHVAHSMNTIFASKDHWGRTAHTLNEALRMVHTLDTSLPSVNI